VDELVVARLRKIRRRFIALLVVWIVLLLVTLSLLSALETFFNPNPEGRTIVSLSWAGYIVSQGFNTKFEITAIKGSWTVPQVNATSGEGYSSMWIGIGGQSDKTLIQVGTEQDASVAGNTCYAWYELLPSYSVEINGITVKPGDAIVASLTLVQPNSSVWNIQLSDATNGQTFTLNVIYNSTQSSGEWILERPTVKNQISSLCDFGTVSFRNCQINMNSDSGPISNFTYSKIQMTNQQTATLASVSSLGPDGSSFNVSYVASS
jgi:Peptidase A4 family